MMYNFSAAKTIKTLAILIAAAILVFGVSDRVALAAVTPSVTLDVPAAPFVGEPISFTATFDNTGSGTQTGYGPYIDLFLPIGGADGTSAGGPNDGIGFTSATHLGAAITTQTLTCAPGATINHPFVPGQTLLCPPLPVGFDTSFTWQFVSMQLPFGSFTADQPPAEIQINATLSNFADVGTPLPIQARGQFRYGSDPLDNPTTDPPIVGTFVMDTVTPILFTLDKVYIGPEDETATGPNFPRQYELNVNIANGQTISDLTITDLIPENMQFLGIFSTTPAATCGTQPSTTTPDGTLICVFDNPVTGTAAAIDAQIIFEFYIPLNDINGQPVLDPSTGDDALSENQAGAEGDWTPLDPRDLPTIHVYSDATIDGPPEHILEDQSNAIQKSVANLTDNNNSPGDVLEYTLEIQISDFFAFEDLFVEDIISDGQHFNASFAPTLVVNGNGVNLPLAAMNATNVEVDCNYTGGPGAECDTNNAAPNDGTTTITFQLSQEMITRGSNGQLLGGCVPFGGGTDYDCDPFNDGPTTATLKFRTIIQDKFTDNFPSGDVSVDQGDTLSNSVVIDGAVLNNSDLTPTGSREDDDSAASIAISRGQLSKTIYARNGVVCNPQPCTNVQVAPADTITYRLRYTLPTSDFEDLILADYLPLPVLYATEVTTFNSTVCGTPGAGTVCYGPADTYHLLPAAVTPVLTTDADANSLILTYGDYDIDPGQPSVIDLLFTVTASNDPFADGLLLTNQFRVSEGSTNAGDQAQDAIVQILLKQPVVSIKKGIINSSSPANDSFNPDPPLPTGVSVSAPGGSCSRLGGPITTSTNVSNRYNSNIAGVDAGDIITFAIVVENTGRHGAFDVRVKDDIPAGFQIPSGGVNLCVTDGTYALFPYTDLGAGGLAFNIELNDPGPTANPDAGLDPGKDSAGAAITTGRNLAIITFDLQLISTVTPNQAIVNTATLFNYSGVEGGPDYTPVDKTDPATTTVPAGGRTKYLVTTSEAGTGNVGGTERVTIGEIVRYRLVWRIPESVVNNAQFRDDLPGGLTFIDDGTARVALVSDGAGIASENRDIIPAIDTGTCTVSGSNATQTIPTMPASSNCLLDDANIGSTNSTTTDTDTFATGSDVYFKFGKLTNNDRDDNNEYVIVEFNALIDNTVTGSNDYNDTRTNTFTTHLNGADVGGNAGGVNVVIAEPCIGTATGSPPTGCTNQINKSVLTPPSPADAGGTVTYRIVMANATGTSISPAYDARLEDTLPAGLLLNIGSITKTFNGCTPATPTVTDSSTTAKLDLLIDVMTPGCSLTVDYTATLQNSALAGSEIINTAGVKYTSLPGSGTPNGQPGNSTGSTTPGSSGDTDGERNGSGGINDYIGSDPASVVTAAPSIDKVTPAPYEYAIGEVITYNLLVTVPEGTTRNLVVDDDLPAGLEYVNGSVQVITSAAASGGLLSANFSGTFPGAPTITAPGGNGGNVTLTWTGNTVLPGDNDTANNLFLVRFQATVLNVQTNTAGKILTNTVYVRFTDGNNIQQTPDQDAEDIKVAVPGIDVIKTADPVILLDPGGTVLYTVEVRNTDGGNINLTSLVDDKFGNLANPANPIIFDSTCTLPQTIPPSPGNYVCTFKANLDRAAVGTIHTNTVTGSGTGLGNTPVSDFDDAVVRIVKSSAFGVTKLVNEGSGFTPAAGWQFSGNVSITEQGQAANDFDWELPLPAGDAAVIGQTKTGTSDANGNVFWTWWPGSKANPQFWNSQFVLNETMQPGYAFDSASCTKLVREANGSITTSTFAITQLPATVNLPDGTIVTCEVRNVKPAIEVEKTASPTVVVTLGADVTFSIKVTNTGAGPVTVTGLTDDKFGNITQLGGLIKSTTCNLLPKVLNEDAFFTCQFVAAVSGPGGTIHTNTVTANGTGTGGVPVTDTDPADVEIVFSVCPAGTGVYERTDILGSGMGNDKKHKSVAKVVIPQYQQAVSLYAQLAGKEDGQAKYVRFIYPNNSYVQVGTITSNASQQFGVFWYGTALNPSAHIRGRWFLELSGNKGHIPRALILYPTYRTAQEYVNVFELVEGNQSQVYWNTLNGWTPYRRLGLELPAPQGPTTLNVSLALVDNAKDVRPVYVTVTAGTVTQSQTVLVPNRKEELNILEFTLTGVPAGTNEVVIELESPAAFTDGLGQLGGDSVSIVGMTAHYACLP